ncbi:hypothetical protein GCM10007897_16940 [Sphingobium jiangsuense]|uniref:Uncharacterized protein n=1 Tax=Sphingobium jiangsuense TaxID=870476 RepID=A0A7W6FSH5_9SPHN|nr:site-specific integrase [Sphingobium jiangsuense]MBB3928049.1 hypothetical protein [Sphingobium jiangsuense]GLT00310.1 hypothetical protein GCM10007897_16940 [Sphingobium jiangsuense]
MAARPRIDRRLAAAAAPDSALESGAMVVFRDRWGEVEQQFDMTASGVPHALIDHFANAFRGHYASAATASRDTCWKALRTFARCLASSGRSVSVGDLGTGLVGRYIAWLDIQRTTSGAPWSLATRYKRYLPVKLLLGWLVATEHIPPIDFPHNPFPGRHAAEPQIRLPQAQLKAILTACYREIDAAWTSFEEGQRLLAQPETASDRGALLHELHRLGFGMMPRYSAVPALHNRIHSQGGALELAGYLHLTVATLVPFFVAIAIQTAANPDALRHMARDCLVPHPLDPSQIMIEWTKPRAGGSIRRTQRRSFDRRRPYAAPNLIEKLLRMTAPLVPHASQGNRDRLFLVRGNGARGIAPIAHQTLTNGIRAFIARTNAHIAASNAANPSNPQALLPNFTPKQFRGSVATRHYAASGGDIRAAQAVLNHARVDTTDLYVRGPEAKRIQDETIARLQAMMVVWVTGEARRDDRAGACAGMAPGADAHTAGHICTDPLAGIAAAPGRLCPAFLGCLACPGLVIPIDAEHLARILQLKSALEAARERIDAHRWKLLYGPSHRILIEDILPGFPENLHEAACRLMALLPPLAEME